MRSGQRCCPLKLVGVALNGGLSDYLLIRFSGVTNSIRIRACKSAAEIVCGCNYALGSIGNGHASPAPERLQPWAKVLSVPRHGLVLWSMVESSASERLQPLLVAANG